MAWISRKVTGGKIEVACAAKWDPFKMFGDEHLKNVQKQFQDLTSAPRMEQKGATQEQLEQRGKEVKENWEQMKNDMTAAEATAKTIAATAKAEHDAFKSTWWNLTPEQRGGWTV